MHLSSMRVAGVSILVAFSLFSATLSAQETSESVKKQRKGDLLLEEVVVSARRRAEDLQQTPVAVTAMSASDLKAINAANIGDITRMVPGLDRYEGRKEANYSIRGIGRGRSTDNTLDPSIGVYIDGIFLARHDSQLLDTVDVESIQVLRGPQGTLFGKNTIGGAILVTTRAPENEFSLSFSGRAGANGRQDAQIAFDIPIIEDRVLSRLTVSKREYDGWAEDDDSNRPVGNDNSITVIGQVLATLTDNLEMRLMAHYSDQDEAVEPYTCQLTNPEGLVVTARRPGFSQTYGEACQESEKLIKKDKVSQENYGLSLGTDQTLFGINLQWTTDYGVLTSITTFNNRGNGQANNNFDGTDIIQIINRDLIEDRLTSQGLIKGEPNTRWGWGQEFQFNGDLMDGKLNYTLGAFASKESIDKLIGGQMIVEEGYLGLYNLAGVIQAPPGFIFAQGVDLGDIRSLDNESYAVFAQASYDLTRDLQLTLGSRYTVEKRKLKAQDWNIANSVPPLFGGLPTLIPGRDIPFFLMTDFQFDSLDGTVADYELAEVQKSNLEFNNVSSMASLSWNVTERFEINNVDNMMAYITVAQGFKAGGFTTLYGELATFEPEKLLSTEIGLKTDLLDNRLRLNMAAYDSAYTDMQMFVVQFDASIGGDFGTTNAGESSIRGFELEATYLLDWNVSVSLTSSYNDAEFQEYDDFALNRVTGVSSPIDRSNEPFPFIPEWTHSLALTYRLETEEVGVFDFMWLTTYRDEIFMGQDYKAGLPEFIEASTADAYSITTLKASWTPFKDDSLTVSLFGTNVFDEEYIAWGVAIPDNTGTNGVIYGNPAEWGFELDYRL